MIERNNYTLQIGGNKMRKCGKLTIIGLVVILFGSEMFFLALPMKVSAEPTTIYVDDVIGSGIDNPNEDYTSIQDAINNAQSGDIIYIHSGQYYENINIEKDGIIIIGANINETIIDGNNRHNVVNITSNSLYFGNLTLINGIDMRYHNAFGLNIINSNHITIENVNINSCDNGVIFDSSYDSTINNSYIHDNLVRGIMIVGRFENEKSNIEIMNNTLFNNSEGVSIQGQFKCSNYIGSNKFDNHNISIRTASYGRISENIIENNSINNSEICGIYIIESGSNIFNNTINNSHNNGIYLKGRSFIYNEKSKIISNNIYNTAIYGIYIEYQLNTIIYNNVIVNSSSGLYIRSSNNIIAQNNSIIKTLNYGIYDEGTSPITPGGNNSICYNAINDIGQHGIYLYNVLEDKLINNTVKNIDSKRIYLYYSDYCNIAENNITKTGEYGIHNYGAQTVIENNTLSYNENYAIYSGGRNEVIENNSIENNNMGIVLYTLHNSKFQYNIMNNNTINLGIYMPSGNQYGIIDELNGTNKVNGKSVYFWNMKENISVPEDAGYVIFYKCSNISIHNINFSNNYCGIQLFDSCNVNISNVVIRNCTNAIYSSESFNITGCCELQNRK